MFITVSIAPKGSVAGLGEGEPASTVSPFQFDWNEPFKTIWEIKYIQAMSEVEAEEKEREKAKKSVKNKIWRA